MQSLDRDVVSKRPSRVVLSFRVHPDAVEWADRKARQHGVERATVIRAMLATATIHEGDVDARLSR